MAGYSPAPFSISEKNQRGGPAISVARGRSCVGSVVLLSLIGCAGQQFGGIFQAAGSGGSDYVVAGSANSVAASLEARLKHVGLSAVITEQGEDIRVASKT